MIQVAGSCAILKLVSNLEHLVVVRVDGKS